MIDKQSIKIYLYILKNYSGKIKTEFISLKNLTNIFH